MQTSQHVASAALISTFTALRTTSQPSLCRYLSGQISSGKKWGAEAVQKISTSADADRRHLVASAVLPGLRQVMRNALVAIYASIPGFGHRCVLLPGHGVLLPDVHENLRMAIPAFA